MRTASCTCRPKTSNGNETDQDPAASGLTEEEIQRMVSDAEANADEDKKLRELVARANACDHMVAHVEESAQGQGDKGAPMRDEDRGRVEGRRGGNEVRDKAKIESATQALSHAAQGSPTGVAREQAKAARVKARGRGPRRNRAEPARLSSRRRQRAKPIEELKTRSKRTSDGRIGGISSRRTMGTAWEARFAELPLLFFLRFKAMSRT